MPPLTPARDETTTRAGGRQSALERGLLRLARVGLVLQLVLIILVVITAFQVGGDGLRATNTREAEDAAANILAAMADQQTGLLTYLKPAQPDSLLLYATGKVQTRLTLASLRADTNGTADAGLETQVEATVRDWENWADALHSQQQPITDPVVIDGTAVNRARIRPPPC